MNTLNQIREKSSNINLQKTESISNKVLNPFYLLKLCLNNIWNKFLRVTIARIIKNIIFLFIVYFSIVLSTIIKLIQLTKNMILSIFIIMVIFFSIYWKFLDIYYVEEIEVLDKFINSKKENLYQYIVSNIDIKKIQQKPWLFKKEELNSFLDLFVNSVKETISDLSVIIFFFILIITSKISYGPEKKDIIDLLAALFRIFNSIIILKEGHETIKEPTLNNTEELENSNHILNKKIIELKLWFWILFSILPAFKRLIVNITNFFLLFSDNFIQEEFLLDSEKLFYRKTKENREYKKLYNSNKLKMKAREIFYSIYLFIFTVTIVICFIFLCLWKIEIEFDYLLKHIDEFKKISEEKDIKLEFLLSVDILKILLTIFDSFCNIANIRDIIMFIIYILFLYSLLFCLLSILYHVFYMLDIIEYNEKNMNKFYQIIKNLIPFSPHGSIIINIKDINHINFNGKDLICGLNILDKNIYEEFIKNIFIEVKDNTIKVYENNLNYIFLKFINPLYIYEKFINLTNKKFQSEFLHDLQNNNDIFLNILYEKFSFDPFKKELNREEKYIANLIYFLSKRPSVLFLGEKNDHHINILNDIIKQDNTFNVILIYKKEL